VKPFIEARIYKIQKYLDFGRPLTQIYNIDRSKVKEESLLDARDFDEDLVASLFLSQCDLGIMHR